MVAGVTALLACVALATGLAIPPEMPVEEVLAPAVFDSRHPGYERMAGLYFSLPRPGLVVLRKGFEKHVRAHELAHHFQAMAGMDPLHPMAEAQARYVQLRCRGL